MSDPEHTPLLAQQAPAVFPLVHSVQRAVRDSIDTTLTWEQLNAPDVSLGVTRPLVARLSERPSPAILYALLLNRLHFMRLAETDLSYSSLQFARAEFCELLAMKLVRLFANDDVELVQTLVEEFDAFQGAPEELLKTKDAEELADEKRSTLEVAVLSTSKRFLSTPLLQRAVSLVHSGQILYVSTSSPARALLPDTYASRLVRERGGRQVWRYDARREKSWLGMERLRIPKWREVVELLNFALIISSFVLCVQNRQLDHMPWTEVVFILVALGFALDEFAATKEHGMAFYSQSLFNGFDLSFLLVFFAYLGLRLHGLWTAQDTLSDWSMDVLACGAAILFPRLAFTVLKGNVVIIALKQMLVDFALFMGIAVLSFSGIFYALSVLGADTWSKKQLLWLLSQIWFGGSYLSFQNSSSFHPIFGPVLLISYAALSNTLLVTILISILSNRYALVSAAAREEQNYQWVINTIGGVKSDAIFSFPVPLNLPALVVLWPLSFVLGGRAYHNVVKGTICVTTWPLLLAISAWERITAAGSDPTSLQAKAGTLMDSFVDAFGGGGDWVDEVFAPGNPAPSPAAGAADDGLGRSEELEAELSSGRGTPVAPSSAKDKGREEKAESPLERLFGRSSGTATEHGQDGALLQELKELKERQERIESMLEVLTRGVRSDSL